MRVLVVDDDPVNRVRARALLLRLGASVVDVPSGREALVAIEGEAFSLVLMDLDMPGMDGVEAVRQIRAAEGGRSHVPVLALTAARDSEVRRCLDAGMDGFVPKPLEFEALAQLLAAYASKTEPLVALGPAESLGAANAGYALDIPYALSRVFGDRVLYTELLVLFASRDRAGPALLEDPDRSDEERRRLIHSLIASAAAIGASALCAAAKAAQASGPAERTPDSIAIRALSQGLSAVLANVDAVLASNPTG